MVNNTKIRYVWILSLIVCASGVSFAISASAAEPIICNVSTIEATNNGTGIDKPLKDFASLFSQKPFNAYNSFKLVAQKEYRLSLNSPHTLTLPEQLSGTLMYKGKTESSLKLTLELSKMQNPPVVIEGMAGNGIPFMAAGFKSPDGRWIFAIKCTD